MPQKNIEINKEKEIIKKADYRLFGLYKKRAKEIKIQNMLKFWNIWKYGCEKTAQTNKSNLDELKYTHNWIRQIEENIKTLRNKKSEQLKNKREQIINEQIKRIHRYSKNNDMASILKEFKKITRKSFIQIKELKNENGDNVVSYDKILKEIDKHLRKT